MKKLISLIVCSLCLSTFIGITEIEAENPSFDTEEDLTYYQFILPVYPDGLRASWNGIHATYLDWHANDDVASGLNMNHQVSTEGTSLLAHYAALRGDQAIFEQMYDFWLSESYFYSQKFQLEHWLLDPNGAKYTTDGNYSNAPGEEVRMLEALKIAYDKFIPTGGRDYRQLAQLIIDGLKGVSGGQGNFEPYPGTPHIYVYSTTSGAGGTVTINFAAQSARYIKINCLEANTPYGYSIKEVEVYGPDTGSTNLALTATATASSEQRKNLSAAKAIDGSLTTRWSSAFSSPQYLEIDLGAAKNINSIVVIWDTASAKSYNVDINPYAEGSEAAAYLLRPWFVWTAAGYPVSTPDNPTKVPLQYNNLVSYYYATTWLGDPFYQSVIDYTIATILGGQNTAPASPGYGLFRTFFDLRTNEYLGEHDDPNIARTMFNFDVAIRLGAYGHLTGNQQAIDGGQLFFDFIKAKYFHDGVVWASYNYETGERVDPWEDLVLYSFFAQLALEYADYDLAEKIIREHILPKQVNDPSDPGYSEGYLGAFKPPATLAESQQNIWQDAGSFVNLETVKTLNIWNNADKGIWQSTYPTDWTTMAYVTGANGAEDIIDFDTVNARYLKVLCKLHNLPQFGYSIFTLQVFGPGTGTTDLALNKRVSVSSVESVDYVGVNAVDGDDATRWSSEFQRNPQWIYVDLGQNYDLNKVRILWETAYATEYEIQVGYIQGTPPPPPPPPPPLIPMHISSITMELLSRGLNQQARAYVTIIDENGNPVSGAAVSGYWTLNGNYLSMDSSTTDASGIANLGSDTVRGAKSGDTFVAIVTGVERSGYTYDEANNVETSDSITVP